MKNPTHKVKNTLNVQKAMTLIEVSLYTVLISVIMTGLVNFLYTINIQQGKLENDIQHAFIQ
jgi:Tfp pilus assembly protein PilV